MALPASPPIYFSQVRTEFGGGSPPANFSAYYRGGGYVPSNAYNTAVSTTAAGLRLSQFYSTQNITPHTVSKSGDAYGADQTGTAGGTVNVTTNSVTATPVNGVGPFTYSWSYVSGDSFTVTSPSSASTTFNKSAGAPSVDGNYNRMQGVYRCTVTDQGNSNYQSYVDVVVITDHYYVFA